MRRRDGRRSSGMLKALRRGLPLTAIGARYGVSYQRVQQILLRDFGVSSLRLRAG